jgi:hypothetical protein
MISHSRKVGKCAWEVKKAVQQEKDWRRVESTQREKNRTSRAPHAGSRGPGCGNPKESRRGCGSHPQIAGSLDDGLYQPAE